MKTVCVIENIYIYVLYTYIYVFSQANESTTFLGLTGLIECVYLTQLIRRRHRRDKIKLSTVSCPQLAYPRPNCRWHFQFWFLQYFYIHSIWGTTYSACNCCATLWGNTQRVFTTSMASRLMDSLSTLYLWGLFTGLWALLHILALVNICIFALGKAMYSRRRGVKPRA